MITEKGGEILGLRMPPDARILEKQNSLRMSQIFSCIRTIVIRWFCFFKDSPSEAASPRRRCSQAYLDTPTPRRSEARLRWPYVITSKVVQDYSHCSTGPQM